VPILCSNAIKVREKKRARAWDHADDGCSRTVLPKEPSDQAGDSSQQSKDDKKIVEESVDRALSPVVSNSFFQFGNQFLLLVRHGNPWF
jgi:hypothetical protein